jgi:hypothetical protein
MEAKGTARTRLRVRTASAEPEATTGTSLFTSLDSDTRDGDSEAPLSPRWRSSMIVAKVGPTRGRLRLRPLRRTCSRSTLRSMDVGAMDRTDPSPTVSVTDPGAWPLSAPAVGGASKSFAGITERGARARRRERSPRPRELTLPRTRLRPCIATKLSASKSRCRAERGTSRTRDVFTVSVTGPVASLRASPVRPLSLTPSHSSASKYSSPSLPLSVPLYPSPENEVPPALPLSKLAQGASRECATEKRGAAGAGGD